MSGDTTFRSNVVAAFEDSKVGSCKRVIRENGQTLAVGHHYSSVQHTSPDNHLTERRSLSHDIHRVRNALHAGMRRKPLQMYSPLAARSRLRTLDFVPPYKNSSQVVFGDRRFKNKRHFLTMAQTMMKQPVIPLTTNPGILCAHTKWRKYKEWL